MKNAGTIENQNRSTVGYVKKDGTVESGSRTTLGYIKDDGTVENSSRSTIGYAKGIKKEWAAVVYFFFKLD
ncbi:5-fold beta-flower protein [Chryseobacterium rhizoplanae]|uniref:5-fold beta-flower protein n=1 Tax=Chryseobacterium rhizoplanae TaxID=1609531 RepID=UPI00397E524C